MKGKRTLSYTIALILFAFSFVLLIGAMLTQGIFGDENIAGYIEIAGAVLSAFTAFIGIILTCISRERKVEEDEYENKTEL